MNKFTDAEFLPGPQSLNLQNMDTYTREKLQNETIIWRRLEDVYKIEGFLNDISPLLIKQGELIRHSLWKVLRTLATHPSVVANMFVEYDPANGKYIVKLHPEGTQRVIVDSYIPFLKRGPRMEPVFTTIDNNDVWPLIIEKALAKVSGGYDAIQSKKSDYR